MAALIKPGSVKVLAKDGEIQVSLTLDININLNTENMIFESKNRGDNNSIKEEIEIKEKIDWAIPDFDSLAKVEFGKKA